MNPHRAWFRGSEEHRRRIEANEPAADVLRGLPLPYSAPTDLDEHVDKYLRQKQIGLAKNPTVPEWYAYPC